MNSYYYKDAEKKIIKADLLDETARELAKSFNKTDYEKQGYKTTKREALTQTQLRKYFNEFRALERRVKNASIGFEQTQPLIKMVNSKVAYSREKIPKSFEDFIKNNIKEVNDPKDFKAFMLHFEAVVGFSKEFLKS